MTQIYLRSREALLEELSHLASCDASAFERIISDAKKESLPDHTKPHYPDDLRKHIEAYSALRSGRFTFDPAVSKDMECTMNISSKKTDGYNEKIERCIGWLKSLHISSTVRTNFSLWFIGQKRTFLPSRLLLGRLHFLRKEGDFYKHELYLQNPIPVEALDGELIVTGGTFSVKTARIDLRVNGFVSKVKPTADNVPRSYFFVEEPKLLCIDRGAIFPVFVSDEYTAEFEESTEHVDEEISAEEGRASLAVCALENAEDGYYDVAFVHPNDLQHFHKTNGIAICTITAPGNKKKVFNVKENKDVRIGTIQLNNFMRNELYVATGDKVSIASAETSPLVNMSFNITNASGDPTLNPLITVQLISAINENFIGHSFSRGHCFAVRTINLSDPLSAKKSVWLLTVVDIIEKPGVNYGHGILTPTTTITKCESMA